MNIKQKHLLGTNGEVKSVGTMSLSFAKNCLSIFQHVTCVDTREGKH